MRRQRGKLQTRGASAMLALGLWLASGVALAAFAEQPDKWVRYVEATGSQYVDTGITGRFGTKAECKVEWMELKDSAFLASRDGAYGDDENPDGRLYLCYCSDTNGTMFTAQNTGEGVGWYKENPEGGQTYYYCRFETNRVYTYVSEFSDKTQIEGEVKSLNKINVDGMTENVWMRTNVCYSTGLKLYLFANNQKGSAVYHCKARCYGLKIWQTPSEGGDLALVRDFQPCMKDGRAGLYDAVSENIFYSSSGTDLVCDENSEVPDEFIEYVESQGSAAYDSTYGQLPSYIDTGIIGKLGTRAAGEVAFLADEDGCFLGAREDDGNTRFYLMHNYWMNWGYGYKDFHHDASERITLGTKYYVDALLFTSARKVKVSEDGSGVTNEIYNASENVASFSTGLPLYLFGCNKEGSLDYSCKSRCYGLKIWQDGALVRDFRPCLKNGVAGLYDDVTKRIFYSSGTPLSYKETSREAAARDVEFVEYIESDGNNTLDTGVSARSGTRAAGEMSWAGEMRLWYAEAYNYLEHAPNVFRRDVRAYLASIATDGNRFYMVHANSKDMNVGYGASGTVYPRIGGKRILMAADEKYSFDVTLSDGLQTVEWNGVEALSTNITGAVDTGDTLHLFSSSYWRNRSAARCYGLKIWQDGVLVRDFKPCVYENKGMLYDMVTKKTYRPSPDIPVSRTGRRVRPQYYMDYVESDGTIFVDTGVIGKSGTAADIRMRFLESNVDKGFLDSRKGDVRFYLWHNFYDQFLYGYGGYNNFGSRAADTDYVVQSSLAAGSQTVFVDGVRLVNATDSASIDTGLKLYIFSMNHDGVPEYSGKSRLYTLKLYQGDTDGSNKRLVRSFRPARLTNGLDVLWDSVEGRAYPAQSVTAPYGYTAFSALGQRIPAGLISIFK